LNLWMTTAKRSIKINKHYLTVFWIISIAAVDVITRRNAQLYFDPDKTLWVIKGVLGFTYRTNYGGLFGILSNWKYFNLSSMFISVFILVISFVYYSKLHQYLTLSLRFFFILLTASLLGNLPDHIFLGYGRDWIVWFGPGVANIADYCTFASFFLLPVALILHPEITWKRYKRWACTRSMKVALGLHLFQRKKNDNHTPLTPPNHQI
jgi:lipoprotein signal peptidase